MSIQIKNFVIYQREKNRSLLKEKMKDKFDEK